ncbi:type II toxin-antitoxin system RelE/ParE family toxin [Mucilaginibacter gotjawali]|uniref:Toxin HigB-2 n=2 Tax=Mucilaginibacter gotjawali TaxID=1550579 RepID=A0A120MYC2_9SPHI|nr:type II toxin-antitoxin system RelE/ParE family toxin [Mucilaginibacter gotjawali]MBB3059086.1 mRNA-degrading endonuclease RelE of RelBE toxin-antitoxin system [Mucilaginibacter gotjawali]BAU52841.1 Toxin HigB-2 [Mucilaginibacter gotjawali]
MANNVRLTAFFLKKAKRLLKKYHTLQFNLSQLEQDLIQNPRLGDNYGANIYKIRLADESKGKGKSGGFRIITYLIQENTDSTDIYLITIFDKSEESSVSKDDIKEIIKSEGIV